MKFLILICLFPIILSAPSQDMDPQDNDTLEEFEEFFHEPEITDQEEKEKRAEALEENEELIKEQNEEYLAGNKTWYDKVNEFSDLPEDEFLKKKTGLVSPSGRKFATGLIHPTGPERVDEESERFFAAFRQGMKYNRQNIPASYSSVALGNVSPVKDQKDCGSCAAYATLALIETCFKRKTGVFSDFSEQQFVDCGYNRGTMNACDGAAPHAYAQWSEGKDLLAEATYPYKNEQPALTCPNGLPYYNRGAKVTKSTYTYSGDEDMLKALVAQYGAVLTGVNANTALQNYGGGIFKECTNKDTNHAVVVVGYGTENGEDYWLIKNSWGTTYGEHGFIRIQRGVGMCGVGKEIVALDCETVAGPTSATLTTARPCFDGPSDCGDYVSYCDQQGIKDQCPKTCGLCDGNTYATTTTTAAPTTTTTTGSTANTEDYKVVTSGTCEEAGFAHIETKEECIKAAKENSFQQRWGPHGGYNDVVDGCSVRGGNQLFLNPVGTCKVGSGTPTWVPHLYGVADCQCSEFQPCVCKKGEQCPGTDQSSSCSSWADAGYCTKYDGLIEYCPKSCCTISEGGSCPYTDQDETSCPTWASRGYCSFIPGLDEYCPKSCNCAEDNIAG